MNVMTSYVFCEKLLDIALHYKTLYVKGCFGSPMTKANKSRYTTNNDYNAKRAASINSVSNDTFGFDCVCLIKGVIWGWNGSKDKTYGGATYASNDMPDIDANAMIKFCSNVTSDFTNIPKGAIVWCNGHVGVHIGRGIVVEATAKWDNCVQLSGITNLGVSVNKKTRKWDKWGKLPSSVMDYESITESSVKINVNGKQTDFNGRIENGKTYIWLRDLQRIGLAIIGYDEVTKTPTIEY